MASRGKRMGEMSLEKAACIAPLVAIATINPNNDIYVMEPEKELLDCINTLGEQNFIIGAADERAYMHEQEYNNNIVWEVVEGSLISNNQNIEQGVTFDIIINKEEENDNIQGQNIHQDVASGEMIQSEEDGDDDEVQGVGIRIDVESKSESNWESEGQSDLEGNNDTEDESSDNSEGKGAVHRFSNGESIANNDNRDKDDEINNEENNINDTENVKKRKRGDTTK